MEEFSTYTLSNGIRCIHRQAKGSVAHCALVVGAGTRDEAAGEFGLAHFTEHGLFKGTAKRKAWQVNCRLENLGGELNAFTTKEDTTLHATVLRSDFTKAVELLGDVLFCSTFPDRELEREKEVIYDEINTYKDAPAELIYDTFEDLIFASSELGHNILGRKANIARFTSETVQRFVARCYTTDQIIFSSIGNFSVKVARAAAERYLGDYTATTRQYSRQKSLRSAPFNQTIHRHTHQAHCIIGCPAYDQQDEKRLALALLINRLGGPCANSLLGMELRERHGLSYNIEASYTPYSDTGVVAIYFSSEHSHRDDCIELIHKQLKQLQTTPFTARQLAMAKRQFIAQMAISSETKENYMLSAGKSLLSHDGIDTLDALYQKIRGVKASELQEVAEECFSELSTLIYR